MRIVIVDENDTVIGAKPVEDMMPSDIYRVARLVIVSPKGQILLAQRALSKEKDPGVWGLAVEGTVEEGETYESNIRKEAQEEIGVTLGDITFGTSFRMTGTYNHWSQLFIYKADLDAAALHLQEEELAAVLWYDIPVLMQEVAAEPGRFGYNFAAILAIVQRTVSGGI